MPVVMTIDKHHLSIVSTLDYSIDANFDLPFGEDEVVSGSACRGLVYFHGEKGRIVVCDFHVGKWKVFDLPDGMPRLDLVKLEGSGLGYDATSKDYKLIRYYVQYPKDEECYAGDFGGSTFRGFIEHMDVYSFNTDSWTTIETIPDASIDRRCAVYVGGCCYWTAYLEPTFGGSDDDPGRCHILSFDCATYTSGYLHFPETTTGEDEDDWSRVVEYRGLLGALIYWVPDVDAGTCSSPLSIKFFVRKGTSWSILHHVTCENVERPLDFDKSKDEPTPAVCGRKAQWAH